MGTPNYVTARAFEVIGNGLCPESVSYGVKWYQRYAGLNTSHRQSTRLMVALQVDIPLMSNGVVNLSSTSPITVLSWGLTRVTNLGTLRRECYAYCYLADVVCIDSLLINWDKDKLVALFQ